MFYVWITTLSAYGDGNIVSALVKRGYTVSSLSSSLSFERPGILGVVIALRINKEVLKKDEVFDQKTLIDEIEDIIKFHKLNFVSLIVCAKPENSGARWNVGNIESKTEESRKKEAN